MGADETKVDEANNEKSAETFKASDPTSCSNNEEETNVKVEGPTSDTEPINEEKEIDAAVRNDSDEHAQIGDPVEPPARNAKKITQGVVAADDDAADNVIFIPMNSKSILPRLFDPDRMQKPALWEHIKLVAPGPADNPPPGHIKWRSRGTYKKTMGQGLPPLHFQTEHGVVPQTNVFLATCEYRCGGRLLSQVSKTIYLHQRDFQDCLVSCCLTTEERNCLWSTSDYLPSLFCHFAVVTCRRIMDSP